MRTAANFDATLLAVKENFVEKYYAIAAARKRGRNIEEPFNADANLIDLLDDNNISEFLTDYQANKILDKLVP